MVDIRKMEIGDYDKVYNLWLSCKGLGLNSIDDSLEGIERFLNRNPETCFVAEVEEKIVGVIMAGHDGRRGFIYHTAVSPDMRRKKIGEKLLCASLKALENQGISKVALVVFKGNILGNDFWESQGFIIREDLTYRNKSLIEVERIDT